MLLDRYSPYLPWSCSSFSPFWNVLFFCLCHSFVVSFHLNSDGPNKAQQLAPYRSYDFLLFLAGCG